MEAWSRRLMTHHAHPLLTPVSPERKVVRRKYRRTALIAARRSLNASLATERERRERVRPRKFYSRSRTFLFDRLRSPMEIKVRKHWGMP